MKHPARTSPYRTATLRAPDVPRVPWRQRLWWRIDREDALQRWSWARREHGGRWCLCATFDLHRGPFFYEEWREVETCPLTWGSFNTASWTDELIAATVGRHRATIDEHGRCSCEVWP